MLKFASNWAQDVADISTLPEFQTATVRLEDPSLLVVGEYDIETGEQEISGDPVVYRGQARIIGVRWGVESGGGSQANSKTIKAIRIQFPYNAVGRVRKGFVAYVEDGGRNPNLENYLFTGASDIQGSASAARTVEFYVDSDVQLPDEYVAYGIDHYGAHLFGGLVNE